MCLDRTIREIGTVQIEKLALNRGIRSFNCPGKLSRECRPASVTSTRLDFATAAVPTWLCVSASHDMSQMHFKSTHLALVALLCCGIIFFQFDRAYASPMDEHAFGQPIAAKTDLDYIVDGLLGKSLPTSLTPPSFTICRRLLV